MDTLPIYSEDLVNHLNDKYKLTNPLGTDDLITIHRRAGQRDVVEYLLILLNRQKEEALTNVQPK